MNEDGKRKGEQSRRHRPFRSGNVPDRFPPLSLAERGLRGVKLVVADYPKGLRAASRRVFDATYQHVGEPTVHWIRNAPAHAPATQRTAVAAMLKTDFAQENKADAEAQSASSAR